MTPEEAWKLYAAWSLDSTSSAVQMMGYGLAGPTAGMSENHISDAIRHLKTALDRAESALVALRDVHD